MSLREQMNADSRRIEAYNRGVDSREMSSIGPRDSRSDAAIAAESYDKQIAYAKQAREAGMAYKQNQDELVAANLYKRAFAEQKGKAIRDKVALQETETNLTKDTASKLRDIAKQMLPKNVSIGMEYLKKAEEADKKAEESNKRNLELANDKMKLLNDVSGNITDQESLNANTLLLKQAGVSVPDKFTKVWNEETKQYWDNRKIHSQAFLDKQKAELNAAEVKLRQDRLAEDIKQNNIKNAQKTRSEELARSKVETAKLKTLSSKDATKVINKEADILKTENADFDNLPSEKQFEVASDILKLQMQYKSQDPTMTDYQAKEKARSTVTSLISDGEYKVGTSVEKVSGSAPQEAIKYLQLNPHLKEQFKTKYGYIPEGI